jgi:hypothetical protein
MKRRGRNPVATALQGTVLLGVTFLLLRSIPELVRYLRIRSM